jgi:hypothetical protein
MPVSSKLAEIIAAELRGSLRFHPHPSGRGSWHRIDGIDQNGHTFTTRLSEIRARTIIGNELGLRYMRDSGYSQNDLNACMKFLMMYLSE